MVWFSQRKGLKEIRTDIQIDTIDLELRNRLWNIFHPFYLSKIDYYQYLTEIQSFIIEFWDKYLKKPTTSAPSSSLDIRISLQKFFFECKWYELYDLLELIVVYYPDEKLNQSFKERCNIVLESELSAYRFVNNQITQITSEGEISEIEEALVTPLKAVNTHLEHALRLLSDRKSPDYRNSIKESISAVEAICRIISNDKEATLGKALDLIERKIGLHGALKRAFDSLYGYTSSAEGIRHALLDDRTSLGFEDAKFMLVSCSAFVNYLISKVSKAGIEITKSDK